MVHLGCGCHSVVDNLNYAGGEDLAGPWGEVVSANITPDATGIGYYSEATFISALRTGYVGARKLNSIMPFGEFKSLSDDDLKAMFAYLRTVPAVKHRLDNALPPTYCKLCKKKHGAGRSEWSYNPECGKLGTIAATKFDNNPQRIGRIILVCVARFSSPRSR